MTELQTETEISASSSRVWSIVTDLDRYHEWNPFIRNAKGELQQGGTVELELAPPDEDPWTFYATIVEVSPICLVKLACAHPDVPGVHFEHELTLEPTREGTRFVQRLVLGNGGVPPEWDGVDDRTQLGIDMMNAALKARAER